MNQSRISRLQRRLCQEYGQHPHRGAPPQADGFQRAAVVASEQILIQAEDNVLQHFFIEFHRSLQVARGWFVNPFGIAI